MRMEEKPRRRSCSQLSNLRELSNSSTSTDRELTSPHLTGNSTRSNVTRPSRLAKLYAGVSAALLLPSQPSRIELEHGDELTVTSEDEWKLCGMELGSGSLDYTGEVE
jgi:hypothetical protein